MTMCRPLPERGGPISRIESSTDAHTPTPWPVPSRYPTWPGVGLAMDGRRVVARFSSALAEASMRISSRVAVPAIRCGSMLARCDERRTARHTHTPTTATIVSMRMATAQ